MASSKKKTIEIENKRQIKRNEGFTAWEDWVFLPEWPIGNIYISPKETLNLVLGYICENSKITRNEIEYENDIKIDKIPKKG